MEYVPVPAINLDLSPTASFAVEYMLSLSDSVRLGDSAVVPVNTIPSEPSPTSFLHSLQNVSVSITPLLSKGVIAAVNNCPKWSMIIS